MTERHAPEARYITPTVTRDIHRESRYQHYTPLHCTPSVSHLHRLVKANAKMLRISLFPKNCAPTNSVVENKLKFHKKTTDRARIEEQERR